MFTTTWGWVNDRTNFWYPFSIILQMAKYVSYNETGITFYSIMDILFPLVTCMPTNGVFFQTHHLSLISGASPGECVRRVMRAVATNNVWSHYSLHGKRKKLALINKTICKVITRKSEWFVYEQRQMCYKFENLIIKLQIFLTFYKSFSTFFTTFLYFFFLTEIKNVNFDIGILSVKIL